MYRLFSRRRNTGDAPRSAISKLQETIDMLEKREAFLVKKKERETEQAKKFIQNKNKKGHSYLLVQI